MLDIYFEKYHDLSNFEINKRVAEALGFKLQPHTSVYEGVYTYETGSKEFDPCSLGIHAEPIMNKYKISVAYDHDTNKWYAFTCPLLDLLTEDSGAMIDCDGYERLRTAMICFLMMVEEDEDE